MAIAAIKGLITARNKQPKIIPKITFFTLQKLYQELRSRTSNA